MARRKVTVRDAGEILDHWQAGRSVRAIACSLGASRHTIRKYIAIAEAHGYRPGGTPPPEGWRAFLEEAAPEIFNPALGSVIFAELRSRHDQIKETVAYTNLMTAWLRLREELGLKASYSSFRRYVLKYLPEAMERTQVTVRRDDPPPGEEAQIDFSYLGLWEDPLVGKRCRLWAFVMVLSHSRHMFACAVRHMDQVAWLESHVAGFEFWGGAPARLVSDNLKSGILKPDLYDPKFNRGYEELAHHYSILIDPARAGKPKDKPRAERAIPYIRESFWAGRTFPSVEEINREFLQWCLKIAGQHIHGTTRQRPLEVFEAVERPALRPLPPDPFEIATWVRAKVGRDCYFQAGGAGYTAPYPYAGKEVMVHLTPHLVQAYFGYELIKTHVRVGKGQRSTDWNDFPPKIAAFFCRTPDWCRYQAAQLGEEVKKAVEALLEDHLLYHLRQIHGIIRLGEKYGASRLNAACARANAFEDPSYRTIKNILERGLDQELSIAMPRLRQAHSSEVPLSSCSPLPIPRRCIVSNIHHLETKLKSLKLGGMLDTLDLRLRQAQQERLGYIEFLELLLEDELERRTNKSLAARVAKAHFEEVKTFESFDFAFNPKMPAQQIRDLATCQFIGRQEWVLFIGPVGVGKSHIILALGHQACRMGYKVLYMKTSRLLADLGGGHADGTWETRLRRYLQPDMLITDDFAMKEFTPKQTEDIYELIDERSRSGSLVIASNRIPRELVSPLP